jgi:hypothetical protein
MGVPGFDNLFEVLNTALGDDLPSIVKWKHSTRNGCLVGK